MFGLMIIRKSRYLDLCGKIAKFASKHLNDNKNLRMEIKGKVIEQLGIQSGISRSGKEWKKAELLIETTENPQYPKKIKLSNMKDAEKFAMLTPGAEGIFSVEIESREFNDRWYTDVNCWKWDITANQNTGYAPAQQPQPATPNLDSLGVQGYQQPGMAQNFPPNPNPQQTDDLPF